MFELPVNFNESHTAPSWSLGFQDNAPLPFHIIFIITHRNGVTGISFTTERYARPSPIRNWRCCKDGRADPYSQWAILTVSYTHGRAAARMDILTVSPDGSLSHLCRSEKGESSTRLTQQREIVVNESLSTILCWRLLSQDFVRRVIILSQASCKTEIRKFWLSARVDVNLIVQGRLFSP